MGTAEIIFLLVGVALLVASCFLPDKGKEQELEYDDLVKRLSKRELSKEETEEIERTIERIISERTEDVIVKTDDYLSKVANEKILSVNEFTDQVIEKIEANHKEVVFLYNMLNEKETELKDTVSKAGEAQRETVLLLDELEQKKSPLFNEPEKKTAIERITREAPVKKQTPRESKPEKPLRREVAEKETGKNAFLEKASSQEPLLESRNKEILELHKQGKSVVEISKLLGLGQGEVRLVVDLYGL